MTRSAIGSRAYGAAAIAIGLDGLAAGPATPLLPFGSSLSLVAAGAILVFASGLSSFAARLAALIFAAWAIVLKLPLIVADPANESVWVGFAGLMMLAAIGRRLDGGKAAGLRPGLAPLSRTDFSAAKG